MFDTDTSEEIALAYKQFYASNFGQVILRDLARFTGINEPIVLAGESVLDAAKATGNHEVLHYIYKCMHTSLIQEIEKNVGLTGEQSTTDE